jgi:uncharacterized protein (DUF924 family)
MQPAYAPETILEFWRTVGPDRWFKPDLELDREIRERFLAVHEAAVAGKLADWEQTAEGALALLILLDQFPRNMFRGTARAFASDAQAREIAGRSIARGYDRAIDRELRTFFYLPFMHSEALADQERCLALYRATGEAGGIKYAEIHLDAIRRFGRFPHRNKMLGRESTPDELAYLESGGFGG